MAQNVLNKASFLIVIGGSAGSLDVLLHLLPGLELNDSTALIIVLHRKNDTDSLLPLLLSSKSSYPVKEAEDKEPILARNIYIAPSDYHLLIEQSGSFSLDDSEKVNYSRPSIDVTLETAALAYGRRMIGVLLSGANSDGTAGLGWVKRMQGTAVVQLPETAIVPFMPQNALEHVALDAVLSPVDLPAFFIRSVEN